MSLRKFVVVCFLCVLLLGLDDVTTTSAARTAPTGPPTAALRIQREEKNAVDVFVSTIRDARHHLAAAAVARCVSIFGMYPIDTFKVRRHTHTYTKRRILSHPIPSIPLLNIWDPIHE